MLPPPDILPPPDMLPKFMEGIEPELLPDDPELLLPDDPELLPDDPEPEPVELPLLPPIEGDIL